MIDIFIEGLKYDSRDEKDILDRCQAFLQEGDVLSAYELIKYTGVTPRWESIREDVQKAYRKWLGYGVSYTAVYKMGFSDASWLKFPGEEYAAMLKDLTEIGPEEDVMQDAYRELLSSPDPKGWLTADERFFIYPKWALHARNLMKRFSIKPNRDNQVMLLERLLHQEVDANDIEKEIQKAYKTVRLGELLALYELTEARPPLILLTMARTFSLFDSEAMTTLSRYERLDMRQPEIMPNEVHIRRKVEIAIPTAMPDGDDEDISDHYNQPSFHGTYGGTYY